jgi:hypothetical protein
MGLRKSILNQGKRVVLTPQVMRWVSDDRVMKAAEGILDARTRVRAAWAVLKNGHALPNIDPALDDEIGESLASFAARPVAPKKNGHAAHASVLDVTPEHPKKNGAAVESDQLEEQLKERTTLAGMGGKDVFAKCVAFRTADNARKRGLYPFFRPLDYNDGPEAVIDGKRVVMFGSNNYLGLTTHPKVREAARNAIDRFGTSMTGSRLVNG